MRKPKQSLLTRLMAEHVEMPGFPQLIVTRHFVYQFLKSCGWDESERGFGSLDYATFSRSAVQSELTDEAHRDAMLAQVRDGYLRDEQPEPEPLTGTALYERQVSASLIAKIELQVQSGELGCE